MGEIGVRRFEPDAAQEYVHPFVAAEGSSGRSVVADVSRRLLDGLERVDEERAGLAPVLVLGVVMQVDDRPDAADQQLVILLDVALGDVDITQAHVCQLGPVFVLGLDQLDLDFVDDLVGTLFAGDRLDLLAFVRTDVALSQRLPDVRQPFRDNVRIGAGAILAQQELKHVDRDVEALLDASDQVFPHHPSRKGVGQSAIQFVQFDGVVHSVLSYLLSNHRSRDTRNRMAWRSSCSPVRASYTATYTMSPNAMLSLG